MSTLPQTGATELVEGQDTPETAVNEAMRFLDANASRSIIQDRDLAAPPGTATDGWRYLIASSPTGLWSGQAGKMAIAVGTNASNGWLFQNVAREGFRLYVRDEDIEIEYNGSAWVTPSIATSNLAAASDLWTGTDATKAVTSDALLDAAVPQALTSSASITPNFGAGFNFSVTLAHSGQLESPSNAKTGQSGVIIITQDGTGGRTWTYGANWKFPGGAPILSTGGGAKDVLAYFCESSTSILGVLTKGYTA